MPAAAGRMRIAQVAPHGVHPYSGVFAALVRLSIELARRGHVVEVWQLHAWPEQETRDHAEALEAAGVHLVAAGDEGRWWMRWAGWPAVADVDLVHLHNVFSPPNNVLARRLRVPYLVSPHGGYARAVLGRHRLRKAVFARLWERPYLRRSRAVCALTEAEGRDIRRFGYGGPLFVIPNGVDSPPPDLDRQAFRRWLGLGPEDRLAVYVGRLDVHYKRLGDLLRAVGEAPRWRLALVGPEWQGSGRRLRRLIEGHGLTGRAWLVGPRRGRSLQEALGAADLFVLPSRSEGHPLALLEALACGTPALVSPEVERVVGLGMSGAGWATEPEGFGSMLRGLADTSPEEWVGRRRAAVALAGVYPWSRVAASYEEMASGVLSEGRRKRSGV